MVGTVTCRGMCRGIRPACCRGKMPPSSSMQQHSHGLETDAACKLSATGGAPNSNFMGPMGGGYGPQGGTMNQYGRPLTPTGGGFQLGIMPGMGAPVT